MISIGIDFGTTNSVLAYEEGGEPQIFFANAQTSRPQLSSAVLFDDTTGESFIGREARLLWRHGRRLVEGFKMLLGRKREEERAAEAFLEHLIDSFMAEHAVRPEELAGAVVTVPDQWLRSEGQVAYRALKRILEKIDLPLRGILSEPVAAACFAAHRMSRAGSPFDGTALVYDHGGGTLDLSLVQIAGREIRTLDGDGIGPSPDDVGVGGMQYDRAVLERLRRQTPGLADLDEAGERAWLHDFEERKIELSDRISSQLRAFISSGWAAEGDAPLFEVMDCEVRASDLLTVFEEGFAPRIRSALDAFRVRHAPALRTGCKIITVGGFSNFCLVRALVEEVFDYEGPQDARFDVGFGRAETSLAIAKGACLNAAGRVQVHETSPIDLAILLKDPAGEVVSVPLLSRGVPLARLAEARFRPERLRVHDGSVLDEPIRLVVSRGDARTEIETSFTPADALPDPRAGGVWRIGAFVELDLTVHLVFETDDERGWRNTMSLGDVIDGRPAGTGGRT